MENRSQSVLDDDRISKLLFKLSLPAFLGMLVMTLYNVIDTIFIGQYVGSLGIAGLSIVFPVQMVALGVGMMTGVGGGSLISRLIGANNVSRAEHALGNVLTATIGVSAIITITGLIDTNFWLRLMGASETILPYARGYMIIILLGLVCQTFALALSHVVRAEGNSRVPMIGMILGAVLNIILDAVFIIPMGMGVEGAALATVIAQLISSIYFILYYLKGESFLKIHLGDLAPNLSILKDILAIGISSFSMTMASSLSSIFVNRALIGCSGDLAVSAFGILNRIMMFAMMPGITIGQGLQPILGYNYSAQRFDRALKAIKIAVATATSCGIIAFIVLFSVPEFFVKIFTPESELIELTSHGAKLLFMAMPIVGPLITGSMVFLSIGKAVQSFITSIARPALFLIPLVLILSRILGLDGVWMSFPISDALALILTLTLLIPQIRDFRRNERLVKEGLIKPRIG